MNLLFVTLKTLFFYFFIILVYRIMGKREIGQLGIIDLIVSILIAELVAISIENISKSIWETVIPISVLTLLEVILAFLSLKSNKIKNIFDGKPVLIINNGKLNYQELIKQRYSLDDLLVKLRSQGYANLEDINYAVLESDGTLTIFKNSNTSPFPLALIVDGKIDQDALYYLNKNETWLINILKKDNILINEVFYGYYKNNKLKVILKNQL